MDMKMEICVFLAYGIGLFLLYFFGKLFLVPIKWVGKLVLNSILGGIFIIMVNLIGDYIGLALPFNAINALIIGFLGVPGAMGLLLFFNL